MPYLLNSLCQQHNVLPGVQIVADFLPSKHAAPPHTEDHSYSNIRFEGACTSDEFKGALKKSCFSSVEEGFELKLPADQKYLPQTHKGRRSIITLKVWPHDIEIVENKFEPGKIKLHFRDSSRRSFRFISITDLGFHDYAMKHHERSDLVAVNQFIQEQEEVFLRIGLSRAHETKDGRNGYWLQGNGIYTFPEFNRDIRSYL